MAASFKCLLLSLLLTASASAAAAENSKWSLRQVAAPERSARPLAPTWSLPPASHSHIGQVHWRLKPFSRAALAVSQLSPTLRPLRRASRQFARSTLYRELCGDGAIPRRECVGAGAFFDTTRLVDALLRPPALDTRPVLKHFGLPVIEDAPPVAYLDGSARQNTVPYPVQEQHLRHAHRHPR